MRASRSSRCTSGPFGRDPIAIRVGRMTVAIRRKHAGAVRVVPHSAVNPLPLVAVAGSPNAGKSALFNALTGARQKVGNYPGVTVERHSGRLTLADGRPVELVDLPGAYSLDPASPDEAVTRDVLLGKQKGERQPDALVIVLDASNLDNHLRFALQLIELGLPTIIALNMVDLAKRDGLELDPRRLERELGVPVIETVAVRRRGIAELQARARRHALGAALRRCTSMCKSDLVHLQRRAREIADRGGRARNAGAPLDPPARLGAAPPDRSARSSSPLIMFVMFQAVFAWSAAPVGWIERWRGVAVGRCDRRASRRASCARWSSTGRSPASAR